MTWAEILGRWRLVTADLQDRGIDVWDRALMRRRPWTWLETHIQGLLAADTRLARALSPEPEQPSIPRV